MYYIVDERWIWGYYVIVVDCFYFIDIVVIK